MRLTKAPLGDAASPERAGPPFEIYSEIVLTPYLSVRSTVLLERLDALIDACGELSGNFERVEQSEMDVGAAVGLEYNLPLDPEYYGGLQGGLQFGAWATRMPGMDFSTTTPDFNIDYGIKTDSYWEYTLRAGGFLNF